METKDKELLLRDLSARLPYGVKLETLEGPQELDIKWLSINMCNIVNPYLPYLFPVSSMTEEQKKEQESHFICIKHDMSFSICRYMEWCYKNHFDINGLLPKGLAIDATGLNIY